jgi:hypothetical protein
MSQTLEITGEIARHVEQAGARLAKATPAAWAFQLDESVADLTCLIAYNAVRLPNERHG